MFTAERDLTNGHSPLYPDGIFAGSTRLRGYPETPDNLYPPVIAPRKSSRDTQPSFFVIFVSFVVFRALLEPSV
jgi:hypothetical protein